MLTEIIWNIVVITAACIATYRFAYNRGYKHGQKHGHKKGYNTGFAKGIQQNIVQNKNNSIIITLPELKKIDEGAIYNVQLNGKEYVLFNKLQLDALLSLSGLGINMGRD